MLYIDPINDCKCKVHNVQTAAKSVLFDEFQNLFLLENYLECLHESQETIMKIITEIKMQDHST